MSNEDNILLTTLETYAACGFLQEKKASAAAEKLADTLSIKMSSMEQPIRELSGGNQQKIVLARAMTTSPSIWLCDEPTQAVDITTRSEIHQFMKKEAENAHAVVYVTSDLKEMLEIADRIHVIVEGRSAALLENKDLKASDVLSCCYGQTQHSGEGKTNE